VETRRDLAGGIRGIFGGGRRRAFVEHGQQPAHARAEIADSARRELATDVAAQREPANIQEAENLHG
jgi:hypothetical protein